MGEVELDNKNGRLNIYAELVFYGSAASELLAKQIATDIALHWNEPSAVVLLNAKWYKVKFIIEG